jgi:hypothetical protein
MRNKAGKDVAISVTSLQAAMKDFQVLLQDGTGEPTKKQTCVYTNLTELTNHVLSCVF